MEGSANAAQKLETNINIGDHEERAIKDKLQICLIFYYITNKKYLKNFRYHTIAKYGAYVIFSR